MKNDDTWRSSFAKILPQPRLRAGGKNAPRKDIKRFILLGRHPNPTADYYFSARLSHVDGPQCHLVDIRSPDFEKIDPDGAFVIVCRYASSKVLDWIEAHDGSLAGVGLFLDDNIPATVVGADASIPYRLFLAYRALLPLPRLNKHLDIVWASTKRLAECLTDVEATVLPPSPPETLWKTSHGDASRERVVMAYHGTSVHYSEHLFLHPIITQVSAQRPQAMFEVFAAKNVAHVWRDMERVIVREPISWRNYLSETSQRRIDIMLVPLTPSLVNDCRSPTKRIDVARTGAAGIFSACEAYGVPNGNGEILLPNEHSAWVEATLSLIDSPDMRNSVANATRCQVEAMAPTSLWGV